MPNIWKIYLRRRKRLNQRDNEQGHRIIYNKYKVCNVTTHEPVTTCIFPMCCVLPQKLLD